MRAIVFVVGLAFVVALAACKQAGTIEVDVSDEIQACTSDAMEVTATFLLDGECGSCNCKRQAAFASDCQSCEGPKCTRVCEGGCSPDEEIDFTPPSAGSYAVILRYYNQRRDQLAIVCFKLDVDADGTQSRTQVTGGTDGCCQ